MFYDGTRKKWPFNTGDHIDRFDYILFYYFAVITKPPYEVTETGWGEFEIVIKIYFNDPNERPVNIFLLQAIQNKCLFFGLYI